MTSNRAAEATAPVAEYFGTFEEFEDVLATADYAVWAADQWDFVDDLYTRLGVQGEEMEITEAEALALRNLAAWGPEG